MMAEYSVVVAGKNHRILIQVSDVQDTKGLKELEKFAISTALLEHCGYLPVGVVNTQD